MTMPRLARLGLAATLLAACGSSAAPPGASTSDGGLADVAPLSAPAGAWTWVDVPESACDDGTPTGIAVNPGSGDDVLVYFEEGGACWDYDTCAVLDTSTHGPFGRAQWELTAGQLDAGPFDRTRATNPFRASSYVFVPYCTGDLHAGDNVATYKGAGGTRVIHHVGRKNAAAALARIAATWPHAARVVVSGTSAGGFGAALNYDLYRHAFPAATMALVDDAGPLLEGEGVPSALRTAWFAAWHLGDILDPLCAGCRADVSQLYPTLASRYPQDRLALVSTTTDPVISLYLMLSLDQFQTDLRATVRDRFDPTTNARVFLIAGMQHGLLLTDATTTSPQSSGPVTLESWLDAMVNGGTWTSQEP
jgi:hypothetical protein